MFTIHDILAGHLAARRGMNSLASAKRERVIDAGICLTNYTFVSPGWTSPAIFINDYKVHEEVQRKYMVRASTIRIKRIDFICDLYHHAERDPIRCVLSFYPTFPGWTCWAKNAMGIVDNVSITNLITGVK